MHEFDRILFPTDFSDEANAALPYAAQLAQAFGSELHLFHATILHDDLGLALEPHFPSRAELEAAVSEHKSRLFDRLRQSGHVHGLVTKHAERLGSAPAPLILHYSVEHDVDLIVMATHGRRGVRRFFLGSVAEEVVRHSTCPVLTVRGNGARGDQERLGRILVPVDLSSLASGSLRTVERLAAWSGAEVQFLHAVEPLRQPVVYDAYPAFPTPSYQELEAEAQSRIEALLQASRLDPARTSYHVVPGPAEEAILTFAQEHPPDLIVLTSHGRTGLAHLFLGSVAEKVVNRAAFPVLTVKEVESPEG